MLLRFICSSGAALLATDEREGPRLVQQALAVNRANEPRSEIQAN
jgi:hypothetical protein